MKAYEQALIELQYPQVTYHVQGGYGEPLTATAVATIAGTVGQIAGSIFGTNRQNKLQAATLEAQTQIAKDQALIEGQIAIQKQANAAQHAANMPIYLLIGGGVIMGLLIVRSKK
jgi:outer membrane lipoprotein SlyB